MNHKDIRLIIVHYRIKCDMAIGERDDGDCSQEEYKKAIDWELDQAEKAIITWAVSKAPDKQTLTKDETNSDYFYGYGYNQAIDDYTNNLKGIKNEQ